jgi:glyoxylase I family protein
MQKVTGIGGFFFRAKDPAALAAWYQTHLGIDLAPTTDGGTPWTTEEGITIFAPFASDTDYFPADQAFMLNFRVQDMEAMLAQLRGAGIAIV